MTTELWLLAASVGLGLVHLIAASHLISWQRGYRWTASTREDELRLCEGCQAASLRQPRISWRRSRFSLRLF